MTAPINDGGPVHPVRIPIEGAIHRNDEAPPTMLHTGISLRDHFAGLAMQAHLITDTVPGEACDALIAAAAAAGQDPIDRISINAYECADSMLRARARPAPADPLRDAAPDLLAALRPFANLGEYGDLRDAFAQCVRPHEREGLREAFAAALAAIAKAEGRS